MHRNQSRDPNKYLKFKYGIVLAMISFFIFMFLRYSGIVDKKWAARVLYWSLFISISYISFILGWLDQNKRNKHLIYYPASAMFGISFILYSLNAFNDFGIKNEIPIIVLSLTTFLCLTYYLYTLIKSSR